MKELSICMPCYNSERFVGQALASLQAQIEFPRQVVVVDDGSTDQSVACVRRACPEAHLLEAPHRGIGPSLNQALREARGDLLAWIDADDLWMPGKLELQLEALRQNPDWDGCFVGVEQFREDGRPAPPPLPEGRHRGALLIRRSAFERVGLFREDLATGEFIDWCARAQSLTLPLLPQPLYRRRIHDQNTMLQASDSPRDTLRILRAHLARKRQTGDSAPGVGQSS